MQTSVQDNPGDDDREGVLALLVQLLAQLELLLEQFVEEEKLGEELELEEQLLE